MTISMKNGYYYGENLSDLETEMARFSALNYPSSLFRSSSCACGGSDFKLQTDEEAGVARRICAVCNLQHLMGDSAEYVEESNPDDHICVCDATIFALLSGVALYPDSNDVRWYYIGCHCRNCGLIGVFAHWKCEAGDAAAFLDNI